VSDDPCGDCVICQTKMIAALMSDEFRMFLSSCVEATLQRCAHDLIEDEEHPENLIGSMMLLVTVLGILDPERIEYVTERLSDMGIVLLEGN
jgi:hypothetical protein